MQPEAIYLGENPVSKVYLGEDEIWSSGAPPADPVLVQKVSGSAVTTGTAATATFSGATSTGNTLIAVFKYSGNYTFTDPAGWDRLIDLESSPSGAHVCILGKQSDGTETSLSITINGTGGNLRMHLQEYSGVPYSSSTMLHTAGGYTVEDFNNVTTWNPAAATTDQDRAVYLCVLGLSAGASTVTSDWSNVDETYNGNIILLAHKIVTNGSSLDTAITWTNARPIAGGVFVLRGET